MSSARKIVLCLIDSAGIFRVAVLDGQQWQASKLLINLPENSLSIIEMMTLQIFSLFR